MKNKWTSVDLTAVAQKIKEQYLYLGLKNILSTGLVLFDLQSDVDKLKGVRVANGDLDLTGLVVGQERSDRIVTAINVITNVKQEFNGHEQESLNVKKFCDELLDILDESVVDSIKDVEK